ncbi:MAG: DUF1553 domain-containing protein [Planctomycetota bacterium]
MHDSSKIRIALFASLLVCFAHPFLLVPIAADEAADNNKIDFQTEIIPVLTKMGCNAGSCHGSAAGRGGFRLSLYGSQPGDDFRAIVQDDKGRRINRAKHQKSLILRKPGGDLDHGGEQRFEFSDPAGQLIANWIKQGAQFESSAILEKFEVGQSSLKFKTVAENHQFNFTATFSDPVTSAITTKDVTQWTVVTANDESSVKIDPETNTATFARPGRHIVIARFLDRVVPIEILIPFYDQPTNNKTPQNQNFIDQYVIKKLDQLQIPTGSQTDDLTFLRRASLDLVGRLPTQNEIEQFEANQSADKREKLIDDLLANPAFTDYWTYRIATQLRIRSQPQDKVGAKVYHTWLKQQIGANESWQNISKELLLAKGNSFNVGPANFYRTTGNARLQTEFVTESLLGVKVRCANCHNHPLDHWTQDDYHGLAAIFAKVRQARVVSLNPSGENIHAKTGEPARSRVPGEYFIDELSGDHSDERIPLTDWITDEKNPYFARSMVNRIWQSLMGRGLVEPVDDLRSTNPATHPELLDRLAADFVKSDFNIRHTIKQICSSEAYQRAVGKSGTPSFHQDFLADARVRTLPPEVLADSIADVTGVFETYPDHPDGTRAVQLYDSKIPSKSLDILGRCSREESCESDTQVAAGGLSAQLHLLNGPLINKKISAIDGKLSEMLAAQTSTEEIIKHFYLQAFSRKPSSSESEYWLKQLDDDVDETARQSRLEDFVWSVLNSKEFTTNH